MARHYLSVSDVAARYGCSEWSVYEWARTGRVPHRKQAGGKRLGFIESELDAWDDGAELEVRKLPRGGRVVLPVTNPSQTTRTRRDTAAA